jgi:pimeloyl-ACP methyl ester carboxylesterase
MPYVEKTFRSRDGLTLFYRDYPGDGSKAPVLCLHGLTRSCRDFEKLALRIGPARRVITPDQRGRGRSQYDAHWLNYHPGVYVDDMWRLLRENALARVVVIGTSLGGLMAILMAAMRPTALAGVVLNDVGPELDPAGVERIREYAGRVPTVKNWDEAVSQMKAMFALALPDFTQAQWCEFARNTFVEEAGGLRLAADPKIGDALRALSAPPDADQAMWLAFRALRDIPTLALRGAHSDLLSQATFDRMQQEHSRLVRVTVPDRGHPPQLDEPTSIAAIDSFLATLEA